MGYYEDLLVLIGISILVYRKKRGKIVYCNSIQFNICQMNIIFIRIIIFFGMFCKLLYFIKMFQNFDGVFFFQIMLQICFFGWIKQYNCFIYDMILLKIIMLLICNVKKMFNISMLCDLNIKFICFMFILYIVVVRVQKNFQKCDFLQILLNYNRLYDIYFFENCI